MVFSRQSRMKITKSEAKKIVAKAESGPVIRAPKFHQTPFPSVKYAWLRYSHMNVNMAVASGVIGKYVFRMNSIYDPDFTGVGHQPCPHDTYQTIYNHYTVLKSRIKATFIPTTNTGAAYIPIRCGIALTDDTTSAIECDTLAENGQSKEVIIYNAPNAMQSNKTMTLTFDARKFFNKKNPQDEDSLGAAVGADPSEVAFCTCFFQPCDLSSSVSGVGLRVDIEYYVAYSELKEITAS